MHCSGLFELPLSRCRLGALPSTRRQALSRGVTSPTRSTGRVSPSSQARAKARPLPHACVACYFGSETEHDATHLQPHPSTRTSLLHAQCEWERRRYTPSYIRHAKDKVLTSSCWRSPSAERSRGPRPAGGTPRGLPIIGGATPRSTPASVFSRSPPGSVPLCLSSGFDREQAAERVTGKRLTSTDSTTEYWIE